MDPLSKSPSYIVRTPYSYCFRMKVPIDIQEWVGKKELRYSRRTGRVGIARKKSRYVAGQVQFIFRVLRRGNLMANLSDDQIKELVSNYIKGSVGRINRLFIDDRDDIPPYTSAPEFYCFLSELDGIRQDLIADLNMGNWGMLENTISEFLKKQGIKDINELLRGKPRSIRSFGTTSIVLGEVVYIHLLFPAPEYMF
jgi:Domain of unknown function (DUF6538)